MTASEIRDLLDILEQQDPSFDFRLTVTYHADLQHFLKLHGFYCMVEATAWNEKEIIITDRIK